MTLEMRGQTLTAATDIHCLAAVLYKLLTQCRRYE